MSKTVEIPFSYGDVIAITGLGGKVAIWLKDPTGAIRGMVLDLTNPSAPVLAKDEIIIRRKTEGKVRGAKLPPVGNPLK
jgi:hypothetical protein